MAVMVKMSCTKAALSSHVIKMILFGLLGQVGPSVPQLALRDIRSDGGTAEGEVPFILETVQMPMMDLSKWKAKSVK